MSTANQQPNVTPQRMPCNKGHLIGPKPPLKLQELWGIRIRLQLQRNTREPALFNLAVESRAPRLWSPKSPSQRCRSRRQGYQPGSVVQQKTRRPVQVELPGLTREVVDARITEAQLQRGNYRLPNRVFYF